MSKKDNVKNKVEYAGISPPKNGKSLYKTFFCGAIKGFYHSI